jgi:predicted nuclease of predicted toxin-antitoxin system
MARPRIRFYTDEHVHRAVIKGLRQRGVDVLSVPEAGLLGASDEEHLSRARLEGRVLFTQDDDFLRLAAAGHPHAGIVYAPQQTSIGEIVHALMLIYQVLEPADVENHIEFL